MRRGLFQALRFPNFRWFFAGQVFSMTGHWLQQVALGWIVYEMTGSAFLLGAIGAILLLPGFVFVPIAGSLADIFDRRRILIVTQSLIALQSGVLAFLIWREAAEVWHLFALSFGIGMAHGFDITVRQSIVATLVDREALTNAVALHSITFNLARLIGPSTAGLLLASGYATLCFGSNAAACAVGAFTFAMIRGTRPIVDGRINLFRDLREGFCYTWNSPPIRGGILMLTIAGLFIFPYSALLPMFASEVLNGDASVFGYLSASPAVGAVFGGLFLAARTSKGGFEKLIFVTGVISSGLLIAFSLARWFWLAALLLGLLGAALLLWTASINTHLQLTVDDARRGRVMSFFTMSFMGAAPAGFLLFGFIAGLIGVDQALLVSGTASLGCVLLLRQRARPSR